MIRLLGVRSRQSQFVRCMSTKQVNSSSRASTLLNKDPADFFNKPAGARAAILDKSPPQDTAATKSVGLEDAQRIRQGAAVSDAEFQLPAEGVKPPPITRWTIAKALFPHSALGIHHQSLITAFFAILSLSMSARLVQEGQDHKAAIKAREEMVAGMADELDEAGAKQEKILELLTENINSYKKSSKEYKAAQSLKFKIELAMGTNPTPLSDRPARSGFVGFI